MVAVAFPLPVSGPIRQPAAGPRPARRERASLRPTRSRPLRHAVYWRRRLGAGALAAIIGVGLWTTTTTTVSAVSAWLGGGSLSAPEPAALNVASVREVYVVQPGDTVWAIAARHARGSDPRPVVDAILEERGRGPLHVGERLLLPE